MKKQTLFFDFDGTILNSFSLYFKTTKHLNPTLTEQEYREIFLLQNFSDSKHLLHQNYTEFFDLISKHAHLYELFPGVQQTLEQLDKHYNLVIVTACPKNIVKYQLSRFRMPQFHKIYGFEKKGSKGEKITAYCAKYNIPINDCYFATDTVGDLLQVHNTGVNTIAVSYGFNSRSQLETVHPHHIIEQFSGLEFLLKQKNA